MTKIISEFRQDNINKKGRHVAIKWSTDNEAINSYLKLPRVYAQQFEANSTTDEIITIFSGEAVPLVQNAETQINKSMVGKTFEVDV